MCTDKKASQIVEVRVHPLMWADRDPDIWSDGLYVPFQLNVQIFGHRDCGGNLTPPNVHGLHHVQRSQVTFGSRPTSGRSGSRCRRSRLACRCSARHRLVRVGPRVAYVKARPAPAPSRCPASSGAIGLSSADPRPLVAAHDRRGSLLRDQEPHERVLIERRDRREMAATRGRRHLRDVQSMSFAATTS